MASAAGHWFLNGLDTYLTYGLIVIEGNGQFLLFPQRKESLSYEWAEVNGRDVDLSAPRFKDKEIKLRCAFVADTEAEYWDKRNAFFTELAVKPGRKKWYINDHQREYSVFYQDSSEPRFISKRLRNVPHKIIYSFILMLEVTEEIIAETTASTEPVYLRDANGSLIATLAPGTTYTIQTSDVLFNGVYQLTLAPGQHVDVQSQYSKQFNVII